MVDTIKFSQMTSGGDLANNEMTPGLQSGANVLFNNPWTFLAPGTTAQRPAPSTAINYRLRFNTDLQLYEYYDAVLGAWTQLQEDPININGPFVIYTADASIPDAQNLGILANGILKQTITAGVATLNIAVNGTDFYGPGFVIRPADGGTGVNNGSNTLTLGGNLTTSGAFASIFTMTADTNLIFPSSGTLATTSSIPAFPLSMANGGTGASLVAALGAIPYSDITTMALLAPGTSGQLFQSGGAGAPIWTTSTYPVTNAVNTLLYASSANVMAALATANSATLITSAGGIPSLSQTLPTAVQANITQLGAQSQALNMNTHLINNVIDPVSPQDAATKNYVDMTALNGTSVYAATTASLNATQSGAGVGATLTDASGTFAAFSTDGVSVPLNQNVLNKNQTNAANQGIYTLTTNGNGVNIPWVLTRATSYDTSLEINNTGLIVIQNGSTLSGQSWYNTATIITVDTTPFNYNQFGGNFASKGANSDITSMSALTLISGTAGATHSILSFTDSAVNGDFLNISNAAVSIGGPILSPISTTANSGLQFFTKGVGSFFFNGVGGNAVNLFRIFPQGYSNHEIDFAFGTPSATRTVTFPDASGTIAFTSSLKTLSVVTQVIPNSATYTPTAGMVNCIVEIAGCGGGSGGSTGTAGQAAASAGGGGGGYGRKNYTAANIGASAAVVIGAGGAAGASGNNAGGTGGNSTFTPAGTGAILTATGGTGGAGMASVASTGSAVSGGSGGNCAGADFAVIGGYGSLGVVISGVGGVLIPGTGGACGVFGTGMAPVNNTGTNGANNYGNGAQGVPNSSGANVAGSAGAKGICIITEYIFA
jgi:hypothetical protein